MANSDTAYGIYNKISREVKIYTVEGLGSISPADTVVTQNFGGNVETAKSYFFTDDALNCFNTNATQLAWAITDDGNGIKFTIAFGVPKDPNQTPWADAWSTTKQSLQTAKNWVKTSAYEYKSEPMHWKSTATDSHLF